MGHVKVNRRSMGVGEWAELRIGWLKRHIVAEKIELTNIMAKEARQIKEQQYEFYDKDWKQLKKGETIFTPDGTLFLEIEAIAPEVWKGQDIWFSILTAAEMIVKVNGKWAGGLDPNRQRINITPYIELGKTIKIEIEGYNRSKPDDDRANETRHLRGCRQPFDGAFLMVLNNTVLDAYYDVSILYDVATSEYFPEDYRTMVLGHIDKALGLVDFEQLDLDIYTSQVKSLRQYLKQNVFENDTYKGSGKVALVAHSHLDIAYYWRKIHTVQKNARTCLIQLRLMDKYDDFCYTHTQPYVYEQLEKYYPEIFEEVCTRVKDGRFEPVGAMYVESDCNVPTAESLIRQCLYGQLYYKEKFNKIVDTCWMPDVFGNTWILPQILNKSGVKYFVSNKMSTWNDTNRFPHNNFIWKGLDGSTVFACVPPTHFITWNLPSQIVENWEAFQDKDTQTETLSMFGYGDGGSGATEEMIEYMHRFEKISTMPKTRHVTASCFLEENFNHNSNLSVWDGELYLEMHRGTFTTKADIKKMNRTLEIELRTLEILSVFDWLQGNQYPKEKIKELYKKLLLNQFHDILPGSHILPVANDAMDDYKEIKYEINMMMKNILSNIPVDKQINSISIFNPLSFERTYPEFIEYNFEIPKANNIQQDCFLGKKGIRTNCSPILPLGCTTLNIEDCFDYDDWFNWEQNQLETPYYIVKFASDGSIESLFDKLRQKQWVYTGGSLNKLRLFKDYPGMYDAWDIASNYRDQCIDFDIEKPIDLYDKGNVFVCLFVELKTEKSTWKQWIRLFKNSPDIEFENDVDWMEEHRLAKADFDINILSRYAKCDSSAGSVIRETHKNTSWQKARFEVCQHKWTDLSDGGMGLALINDCKYGISIDQNKLGISLLRATVRPDPTSDKGNHKFSYLLLPHDDTPEEGSVVQRAWAFNTPLIVLEGNTLSLNGFVLTEKNLHIQSIKLSEFEDFIVIRIVELYARSGYGNLQLNFIPESACLLDMLEREVEGNVSINGNTLTFAYAPNEILTIGVKLSK